MHPLYDPRDLTDDEILEKLRKCYNYRAEQERLGHDPTVASIENTIAALEGEKMRRFHDTQKKARDDQLAKEKKTGNEPIELGKIYPTQDNNNEKTK